MVVITGLKANGEQFLIEVDKNEDSFFLEELNLKEIDLTPLKEHPNLRVIGFEYNQLTTIDFSPLEMCPKLQELYIVENDLTSIILPPEKMCANLWKIKIDSYNEII